MPKLLSPPPKIENFGELLDRLGGIAPSRIRLVPPPGRAKERHVVEINDRENRLFELVDGVLVEKAMGALEALLAGLLVHHIWDFLE